jgi:carbamoyl-phosphate synthase large subunit
VLEANPRASRTVPLVSKVCAISMANIATRLMMGQPMKSLDLANRRIPHFGAKEAVFPFDKFMEVDPVLGPEMRSTGEVLGLAKSDALAFYKSQEAAGAKLPDDGAVLISLSEKKENAGKAAREFADLGFKVFATEGTAAFLARHGVQAEVVRKIDEGRPNVLDYIVNGQLSIIINTPSPRRDALADDASIRKAALKYKVPYITTVAAAHASARGIAAARQDKGAVRSLQEYHRAIR